MHQPLRVDVAAEPDGRVRSARPIGSRRRPSARATVEVPASAPPAYSAHARRDDQRWLDVTRCGAAEVFGEPAERRFTLRYWTGFEERPTGGASDFTLVLTHAGALRRMLLPPSELAIGEAFVRGDFDVEGSLERAAALAPVITERLQSLPRLARLLRLLRKLPANGAPSPNMPQHRPSVRHLGRRHSRGRDAEAIRHHYDVGNEFYELWLDEEMVYSCAYFRGESDDLDDAQRAKLDHICRKLRLQPGERFLDIGCGWGGLIRHAARHYGVRALGITLSPAQASHARERIASEGLADQCRVEVRDYRELGGAGQFDKVVSVGMVEHVGRRELVRYFRTVFDLTAPGGLFLNHGIVSLDDARSRAFGDRLRQWLWRRGEFMDRYVFPDGELATLGTMCAHAERAGYEPRDVEGLREHYTHTLRHWVRRLEARAEAALSQVGAPAFRVWRLYMAVSAHAFAVGRIGVAQVLLARPDAAGRCHLPLTREDLHASTAHPLARSARQQIGASHARHER